MDWAELAKAGQTLVIYMGLVGIEKILQRLIDAGREVTTPAVLLENATFPEQREIFGSLEDLAERVLAADVQGPSIIIVGEVAAIPAEVENLYAEVKPPTDS
jgi:siroheme synthase